MFDDSQRRSTEELAHLRKMRAAGRLTARILDEVAGRIKPGVTTNELNTFCDTMIRAHDADSALLNYRGFPKSICTSVNRVAAHGIPNDESLKDGDVIKVDVSLKLDGVYGDCCRTYFVGTPSAKAREITQLAYDAMIAGIKQVKPGNTLGDIGHAISKTVKGTGYSVLTKYSGHGIGKKLHTNLTISNDGEPGTDQILKRGMIFTIEPVIVEGDEYYGRGPDKEILASPGKLSAQFEHTILVTDRGCEILTASPKKIYVPASLRQDIIEEGPRL